MNDLKNGIDSLVSESAKDKADVKPIAPTPEKQKADDIIYDEQLGDKFRKAGFDVASKEETEAIFEKAPTPKPAQSTPLSLAERRKKWHENLRESAEREQQEFNDLRKKYQAGEISSRDFKKLSSKISKKYANDGEPYPKRDRLPIEDEIDANEKEFKRIREELDPLEEEDNIAFNMSFMPGGKPYDKSKRNPKIDELNKQIRGVMDKRTALNRQKALQIGKPFGRKDYREGIDKEDYGQGNDRIYALYQYALENPYLDFGRIISNDIYENREKYPSKIEFGNDLYEISESGGAYDHWRKDKNGKWEHVSLGSIAGLGNDLEKRLEEGNIIEPKQEQPTKNDEDIYNDNFYGIKEALESGKIDLNKYKVRDRFGNIELDVKNPNLIKEVMALYPGLKDPGDVQYFIDDVYGVYGEDLFEQSEENKNYPVNSKLRDRLKTERINLNLLKSKLNNYKTTGEVLAIVDGDVGNFNGLSNGEIMDLLDALGYDYGVKRENGKSKIIYVPKNNQL